MKFKKVLFVVGAVTASQSAMSQVDSLDYIQTLDEIVVSGTMKPVTRSESSVPVEVYSTSFFKANPVANVFEAVANINGVRPQVNCNVCNTGDIHINGLEGPYTMVLIDGMPIVSGLSTVYGLSGIPQSLIEQVEVVKGPASALYGSEAVGGLINVITKNAYAAPRFSLDAMGTTWQEYNVDLGTKLNLKEGVSTLLGVNYFNYQKPIDKNKDNFTDVTLQHKISVFNKWDFAMPNNKMFSIAGRYLYEDRWGGEMDWTPKYRGGDQKYAESIYTNRGELFGKYELPTTENLTLQFSASWHDQNSYYGNEPFMAQQNIYFGQLLWDKKIANHDLLLGLANRYTYYNDNTPATSHNNSKQKHSYLPGIFIQDEVKFNSQNALLAGLRYDHHSVHGSIFTPRVNYKWNTEDKRTVLRFSIGNGYRVANIFTEDHAALTGARDVIFTEKLKPETSWNANINGVQSFYLDNGTYINLDAMAFYTHFGNKIIPDYETDPNKIIYANLHGHAVSKGVSLNTQFVFPSGLKILAGGTLLDVYSVENNVKSRQLFTERFTGTWTVGYEFRTIGLNIDYTGNLYSPMRLPLLSKKDPRPEYSPWWSIQNIQITKNIGKGFEIYGGVKNLLNWTPAKNIPFLIARTEDPFDKNLGVNNPYDLTFDPTYVYAPNQGIRGFLGVRLNLK